MWRKWRQASFQVFSASEELIDNETRESEDVYVICIKISRYCKSPDFCITFECMLQFFAVFTIRSTLAKHAFVC